MIVKIDKLAHDFRGITKVNDKVTFVSGVLPSEVVDIKVIKEKKNINEAEVISFDKKSEDRIEVKCPYSDRCGGCDAGYIRYDKLLEYKREIFSDIMKRYANLDIKPSIIRSDNIYGYRNKITLKVLKGKLAFNKHDSNELINVLSCPLANDKINNVMKILNSTNLSGVLEVTIKGTDEIMVVIKGNIDNNLLITKSNSVSSIILNGKVIYGNEYIRIKVNDIIYAIYPESFFQVNTSMISKLYDKIKEEAGTGKILADLYCGAGTIGIYLADNFDYVYGIEVNSDAVKSANLNKEINGIDNISFECKKVSDMELLNSDVITVDPPRSGLDKKTIELLSKSGAKKVIYVSCNPITLARDINLLKDNYKVNNITLFDMFPNTKHMESVCTLNLL